MASFAPTSGGTLAGRFLGRFLAAYTVLYILPFPLDRLPMVGDVIGEAFSQGSKTLAAAVGTSILGIDGEIFIGRTGSGDTTADYIRILYLVVGALVGALIGSWLARRRSAPPAVGRGFAIAIRFYLAFYMLDYGLSKVIPVQFIQPPLERLLRPLGETSPMGLVWTFMGVSPAYTIFSGLGESLAGILLLFRRTATLGALVAAVVMTNVVMLNFAYDVPVKLFSSHLLAMAGFLMWRDRRRLIAVFWGRGAVPAPEPAPPLLPATGWSARVPRWLAPSAVALFALWLIGTNLYGAWSLHHSFGNARQKPAIWGIHEVEDFRVDGEERPPVLTDSLPWRALVVDRALPRKWQEWEFPGRVVVQSLDGSLESFPVRLDESARTLSFLATQDADSEVIDTLAYERSAPDRMVLTGTWQGHAVEIHLRERDLGTFELIGRGFHWINELPYNR
ncbi:MAG: hypothetical protein AAF481_10940 [Acidobacteriota bacterium]